MDGTIIAIHLVEAAFAISVLEGLALVIFHRVTGQGLPFQDFALNLASGLCLMLALRNALMQSHWLWVGVWLLCAGLAHWVDVWRRWQARRHDAAAA
jgi:hypothetical protein